MRKDFGTPSQESGLRPVVTNKKYTQHNIIFTVQKLERAPCRYTAWCALVAACSTTPIRTRMPVISSWI